MSNHNFSVPLPTEASNFTPAEIAEIEQIYQAYYSKHQQAFIDDKTGMLERISTIMSIREVQKRKTQAQELNPPPITTAPQQEKPKPEVKPKKTENNVVRLALTLPEKSRAVSNATVRAALFAAIQGENRELLDNVTLTSQNGIQIIFTGRQLNQDDHDVFMQLVAMAIHKPLGEDITISASAILAGLGRDNGKSQHEQLKKEIHRLVTGTVNIKCNGINFIGHLINDALQDETLPAHERYWTYQLNPKMAALFGRNQYTLIDWEQRKKLKQKDLARWLHLYYASHSAPFPVSVEFLREISGSKTKELWKFRENLKKALEALKEVGFITHWDIEKATDLVRIDRAANVKQVQTHIENPSVLLNPPIDSHYVDRNLETITIEKFRALYPRLDPYACKVDFQLWLIGKSYPTNYDAAFLGFAKKWVKGKV